MPGVEIPAPALNHVHGLSRMDDLLPWLEDETTQYARTDDEGNVVYRDYKCPSPEYWEIMDVMGKPSLLSDPNVYKALEGNLDDITRSISHHYFRGELCFDNCIFQLADLQDDSQPGTT